MAVITRSQAKSMNNQASTPNKKRKNEFTPSPPPSDDTMKIDSMVSDDEESVYTSDEDYDPKKERLKYHGYRKDSFIASDDENSDNGEDDHEDDDSEEYDDDDDDDDDYEEEAIFPQEEKDKLKCILMKALQDKFKTPRSFNKETNLKQTFTDEEETYFKSLSKDEQDKLALIYTNVISSENSCVPMKFQILHSGLDNYAKNVALQKYNAMMEADESSGEYLKMTKWIQKLCAIPFNKYKAMPVNCTNTSHEIKEFLKKTETILNEEVYGHTSAKSQIMRIVAQWVSNPTSRGNVIGIHGNPGVGKTTLIKNGVCKALDLPFAFIPLGGASDSSFLEGHSYTYEGSSNGKIVDVLMKTKIMNPVLYFDELDKVSESKHGREIINLLIHLTDPIQNHSFQDRYFNNINFDLSRCLIIFTYNNNLLIDPILKDRMITIHTKDYNTNDKIEIAKSFILPSISQEFNLSSIQISDEDIKYLISLTSSEAGVRNLKRSFENIVSHINLERLICEEDKKNDITIQRSHIDKYIKNSNENNDELNPSLAHLYT